MKNDERIAALEREIENLKTRLNYAEARLAVQQTVVIREQQYIPSPSPWMPPYIVTC